eukprot:s81_g24.t1
MGLEGGKCVGQLHFIAIALLLEWWLEQLEPWFEQSVAVMSKLLLLTLQLVVCVAWRSGKVERRSSHETSISSFLDNSEGMLEETSSAGMSKVLCSSRLPYFRNRLCMEVKTHTDDLVNFITAENSSEAMDALQNPIRALPDLTLDFAWMGCSRCTPAMRVCSPGQPCRKDPDSPLNFPWIRVLALSLKSLVAGQCISLTQLLVVPAVSIVLMPLLEEYVGALAPYLGGVVGYTYSRLLDELLLGRYCIYLTTHVAGEVIAGKTLTQDMRCIDHLYKIHIPGIFGLIPSKEVSNPESSLVCWPTAEALSKESLVNSMEAMEEMEDEEDEDEEEEDLRIPEIPSPELLSKDKVCRSGASATFCTACETVSQALWADDGHPTFERIAVSTNSAAVQVDLLGLRGSMAFNSSKKYELNGGHLDNAGDRAVLVQSRGNLQQLLKAGLKLEQQLSEAQLQPGCFGENLFVDGSRFDATTLCVGDVIQSWRDERPTELRTRRCPCGKVDEKLGKTCTLNGATRQGGTEWKVVERPHPQWTLSRVSHLIYGNDKTVMQYLLRSRKAAKDLKTPVILREEFMGSQAELEELASLEALATFEWREYLVQMLGGAPIGRYKAKSRLGSLRPAAKWILVAAVGITALAALRRRWKRD